MSADGGTNYDQGLSKAATAINSSNRENAKKIVIFLTDGKPTYYGTNKSRYGDQTSKNA
ncbi:MAG: vWA domain-containing protein [Blautia sp.]